jgi:hypothetical protein
MAVRNVTAGVVRADGAFGYVQPVDDVLAYEKQISISGVRLDITGPTAHLGAMQPTRVPTGQHFLLVLLHPTRAGRLKCSFESPLYWSSSWE